MERANASCHRFDRGPVQGQRSASGVRARGFTLVELLTVITIIAILATLLLTTLSSVKRKAREAVCTSNLHQIGIALNLYLEDFHQRPPDLGLLVTTKYLPDARILTCPADKTALVLASTESSDVKSMFSPMDNATPSPHVSYQHPLGWPEAEWTRLMQLQTRAGVVVCTFHDVRPSAGTSSLSPTPPRGLILRGQLDGAVVRRQFYRAEPIEEPPAFDRSSAPPTTTFGSDGASVSLGTAMPPWEYFTDEPPP